MMRFARLITTIDAHAAGEPLRIVTGGLPPLPGATMLERRRAMLEQHDDLRRLLMWEPRGHADMYGCILTPPVTPHATYGVLFMHNEGYSTMCGHGIIALTTALVETGAVAAREPFVEVGYDTPAGFVLARAEVADGRVRRVAFRNVPSFVYRQDLPIEVDGAALAVDVVFGGAFYALVEAAALRPGLAVEPANVRELIERGMAVKRAVEAATEVVHPTEPGLRGVYGTTVTGPPTAPGAHGRNVTIFADGEVDRSPCGTGTAGRVAALHARGALALGQEFVHESIIGTTFAARAVAATRVGDHPAIVPEIAGRGYLTGLHQFVHDPDDRAGAGFLVR
ncbi:MAG TPA: proline racemase family protein [Thermomicrobiales bacterium]|nr:proline racemase family protein [Thermomicrobiales bacterium]